MARQAAQTMVVDLLKSCSSAPVARAALASIGGPFAERVRRFAECRDMSAGLFASAQIRRFSRVASADDLDELSRTMAGVDQPVLVGFRAILARSLQEERERPDDHAEARRWRDVESPRMCA